MYRLEPKTELHEPRKGPHQLRFATSVAEEESAKDLICRAIALDAARMPHGAVDRRPGMPPEQVGPIVVRHLGYAGLGLLLTREAGSCGLGKCLIEEELRLRDAILADGIFRMRLLCFHPAGAVVPLFQSVEKSKCVL